MVQMPRNPAEQERLSRDSRICQTRRKLLVLGAPTFDRLVEAVDTQEILSPISLIAPLDSDRIITHVAQRT